MTLLTAKTILVRDRMDWHKPHLNWMSNSVYRFLRRRSQ